MRVTTDSDGDQLGLGRSGRSVVAHGPGRRRPLSLRRNHVVGELPQARLDHDDHDDDDDASDSDVQLPSQVELVTRSSDGPESSMIVPGLGL